MNIHTTLTPRPRKAAATDHSLLNLTASTRPRKGDTDSDLIATLSAYVSVSAAVDRACAKYSKVQERYFSARKSADTEEGRETDTKLAELMAPAQAYLESVEFQTALAVREGASRAKKAEADAADLALRQSLGVDEAEEATEEPGDRLSKILQTVAETPARSLVGLAAKARIAVAERDDPELLRSLARDVNAILGRLLPKQVNRAS